MNIMKREWLQSYLFQLLLPCNKPQHSVVYNNLSIVFTSVLRVRNSYRKNRDGLSLLHDV